MIGDGFRTDKDGYYIETRAGSTLDYGIEWGDWLKGNLLTVSTWETPTGVDKITDSYDQENTAILIRAVSPGTYIIRNSIQTAELQDSREFRLIVED